MDGRNLTVEEKTEICEWYRSGKLASEIAVKMKVSFVSVIGTLIRDKQIDPLEYGKATMMPLEWIEDWLKIYRKNPG